MSGQPITKQEVAELCRRIKAMPDDVRLDWATIVGWSLAITGRSFTRQALADHKSIGKAYRDRLKAYRERRRTGKPERLADETPDQRMKRILREENESLRATLEEFDRRIQAVIAHVTLRGIDVRQIDLLPRMDRERPPKSMG